MIMNNVISASPSSICNISKDRDIIFLDEMGETFQPAPEANIMEILAKSFGLKFITYSAFLEIFRPAPTTDDNHYQYVHE